MRPLVARTLQLVLRAYPAEFRRSYGDAVLQTVADRHDHEGVSWTRILAPEFLDATRVAPLMRWESPMNRIVIVVLAAAVVGFVAVAVSPATLIPLAVVMIAAVAWWARQNRPFDAQQPAHRWYGWLGGGAAMIAIGFAIPAIDGGELHSGWWTVFALALLTGTAMILTAVILAVNGQSPRSEGPTH